jgi:hypothetical protein
MLKENCSKQKVNLRSQRRKMDRTMGGPFLRPIFLFHLVNEAVETNRHLRVDDAAR